MRRAMVAGNWKLNGSADSAQSLSAEIAVALTADCPVEVVVCPAFVYLQSVRMRIIDTPVKLGAQNASEHDAGAFTGEVSAPMLADCGCEYVIVGHSERRAIYAETDAQVAAKYVAVQRAGLMPILCLGESLKERERHRTETVIARQLDAVVDLAGEASLANATIAYEPVWAIGSGRSATPVQAQAVHAFIRGRITNHGVASAVRILYGGSIKPHNAGELFAMPDIDGGLIGGAALHSGDFVDICRAARPSQRAA